MNFEEDTIQPITLGLEMTRGAFLNTGVWVPELLSITSRRAGRGLCPGLYPYCLELRAAHRVCSTHICGMKG